MCFHREVTFPFISAITIETETIKLEKGKFQNVLVVATFPSVKPRNRTAKESPIP